jgi:serine/threonine protein kinase
MFCQVFRMVRGDEQLFIAIEYLESGDLATYLFHSQPLPESEAKDLSYQILDGLCMMHENGFAHRDLKPAVSSPDFLFK